MVGQMKETLVRARLGLEDLQTGVSETRVKLATERRELETVRRRREMAARISDGETVAVAERFERQHAERVEILERKLAAQEAEVASVEREVGEMTTEFRAAHAGVDPSRVAGPTAAQSERAREEAARAEVDEALGGGDTSELDALRRRQEREMRDARAEELLEELKRRMGR
ncbi:MAG TPA: hypothetical protein VGE02_03115 [Gemmatimonadales bacterium]